MSDNIHFFGSVDCDKAGNITSDMPAWYNDRHTEELEEAIRRKKGMLKRGEIPGDQVPVIQGQIDLEQQKLNEIQRSKPQLNARQIDKVAEEYKSLGQQLRDDLPTRKESRNGLVSPYNELKRLKSKHISVDPEIASACGCKPVNGKISGDEAAKCFQIMGKTLGENTNIERLRKDGGVDAYKTIHDLTQAILSGKKIGD